MTGASPRHCPCTLHLLGPRLPCNSDSMPPPSFQQINALGEGDAESAIASKEADGDDDLQPHQKKSILYYRQLAVRQMAGAVPSGCGMLAGCWGSARCSGTGV